MVASVAGVGFLLPNRLANYRWSPETLARIDTVAYVLFASVYKNFQPRMTSTNS